MGSSTAFWGLAILFDSGYLVLHGRISEIEMRSSVDGEAYYDSNDDCTVDCTKYWHFSLRLG
jgi:hypothetical protein